MINMFKKRILPPQKSPHPLNLPLLEGGEGDFLSPSPPLRSGRRCGGVGVRVFLYLPLLTLLTSCQSAEKMKMEQYYIGGKEIFEKNCANCHQKDGKGLQNLYPPIAGSDYLQDKTQVILAIKHGLVGEIKVNGKTYNQPMPANSHLQNLDIAEVVTYIYNEWGNEQKITTVEEVEKALKKE
jgi:mono/diheme cytochrome c family protein